MGRIILIMGDLASGKSTYAKILSKSLNIPYFLKDTFKEILSDTIGYNDRPQNRKLSLGAFWSMFEISERLMEKNISFILESNFRQEELDSLKLLIDKYKYDSLILFLKGDIKVLHDRYLERIKTGRHETHLVVDLMDYKNFEEYTILNRKRELFKEYEIIDATDFLYQKKLIV